MLDYLLKSGGCLLVFYLFYVLFLEKENMHIYKRVYLLSILVVSFIIPLVTFTSYVDVVEQIQPIIASGVVTGFPIIAEVEQQNYLPIALWSIYGFGVLLFGLKFIKNSYEIINKIKNNPKEKSEETTSVLLNEDIVPHTFFNFIFFNKQQFISNQIPKEVILHEKTHARQKHSVDVLLLEFLQVVFWFNPVLFLLNKSIKLNHEFLADQAVLNTGANTKTYQQTLLAYSSNASQLQLAHAINYSSIKKRFTVMNTHTSKKKAWIRSFFLLPLFALLLFSFSTTIQQEKATPKQVIEYNALAKRYNEQPTNNRVIKYVEIKRMKTLYDLMNSNQKTKAEKYPNVPPPPPPSKNGSLKRVTKEFYEYKNDKGENIKVEFQYDGHQDVYSVLPPPPIPKNATKKQRKAYVKATDEYKQKIAAQKRILDEDEVSHKKVSHKLSIPSIRTQKFIEAQAKKGAKFYYNKKEITAAKAISIINNDKEINISSLGLVVNLSTEPIGSNENKEGEKKLQEKATPKQVAEYNTLAKRYNKQSKKGMLVKLKEVNRIEYLYKLMTPSQKKKAEKFPSFPPMPPSSKVIKGVNDKESNIPPPPAPPKIPKNADYVVDNKKVSYDEASKIKDNEIESVDVATKDANGNKLEKSVIYIYTKKPKKIIDESQRPVTSVNGIGCIDCKIELTKEKLGAIVLSTNKGEIVSFNIKFPKKPTVRVNNSNVLNKEAKMFLAEAKIGESVMIFGLKSSGSDLKSHPVRFDIVK